MFPSPLISYHSFLLTLYAITVNFGTTPQANYIIFTIFTNDLKFIATAQTSNSALRSTTKHHRFSPKSPQNHLSLCVTIKPATHPLPPRQSTSDIPSAHNYLTRRNHQLYQHHCPTSQYHSTYQSTTTPPPRNPSNLTSNRHFCLFSS